MKALLSDFLVLTRVYLGSAALTYVLISATMLYMYCLFTNTHTHTHNAHPSTCNMWVCVISASGQRIENRVTGVRFAMCRCPVCVLRTITTTLWCVFHIFMRKVKSVSHNRINREVEIDHIMVCCIRVQ